MCIEHIQKIFSKITTHIRNINNRKQIHNDTIISIPSPTEPPPTAWYFSNDDLELTSNIKHKQPRLLSILEQND